MHRPTPVILMLAFLIFGGTVGTALGAGDQGMLNAGFEQDVLYFAGLGDRSTASGGSRQAAQYIQSRLADLGFTDLGTYDFTVPVVHVGDSRLMVPDRGLSMAIRPLMGNAVTPPTTSPDGIRGPLVYVGNGTLESFNGQAIEDAIVIMELDSGKNWQIAANLGARALIYVDRGDSDRLRFEDKVELSPVEFPRFWMSAEDADMLLKGGADLPQGRLICEARWENTVARNIYCLIPGSRPDAENELVMVEAFFESTAHVPGLSPGADEACSIATLLQLAAFLKRHPPQRNILLVASGGHAQALSGMREMFWILRSSSRALRQETRRLEQLIDDSRSAVKGLSVDWKTALTADRQWAETAIRERIKTEADDIARRLMHLRMDPTGDRAQHRIEQLAAQRQALRRLLWRPSLAAEHLDAAEMALLRQIQPRALADQQAILDDTERQRQLLKSATTFRSKVKAFDLLAAISLHLSSHGDGFGAFDYGWLYPFKPKINRVANYRALDQMLHRAAREGQKQVQTPDIFKDTLRPNRQRSWQSYFLDRPPLGGEVSALAGYHGFSLVTTNDARAMWGTPYDTPEKIDVQFALDQAAMVCHLVGHLGGEAGLHQDEPPRQGFATIDGRARFLRQGELFPDQPAPGTVLLVYQGPALMYAMADAMGNFKVHGLADADHSFHKAILEGYKIDPASGRIIWVIDKKQTGKDAYRIKMRRKAMETDLVLFAGSGLTLFNLLEPRTLRHLTKVNVIDGRREAAPVKYFYSRLDTWRSTLSTFFMEPGAPLKLTLSDSVLDKKLLLLNNSADDSLGTGYWVERRPILTLTEYHVAHDMWVLLNERIKNIERRGIFNQRIHDLSLEGTQALVQAEHARQNLQYDRLLAESTKAWALANRVYEDVENTQKDVLYGVLFYIALFVPFAFCAERLLFAYANIYKRIVAFIAILLILIAVIYQVHPAFQLAYSPMVVILAFLIMGLSLVVTLIIFLRFEAEIQRFHSRAGTITADNLGRWKAFAAAFWLGVSNLRRRPLRTALTCITLIILTFTIMSFTSAKSMRLQTRLLYDRQSPYQGILMKNTNWRDLPGEAYATIASTFADDTIAAPRVWLEAEDRTRTPRIPVRFGHKRFDAQGLLGLSAREPSVSGIDRILVAGRWLNDSDRRAVLLPDHMARQLGIDIRRFQKQTVDLWGMPYEVVGIFAAEGLQTLTDLDGETLTPVTFPREVSAEITEEIVAALESGDDVREFQSRYQHIESHLTLIVPYQTLLAMGGHLKAVSLRPPHPEKVPDMARSLVDRYGFSLFSGEPGGIYLYQASDTMSYSGVPNIIIPIVISILIVLNTMISSVYERKREIGIYTSVGLAPVHVSFLFVAEAMAFAVLSTVAGYLLAQTAAAFLADTSLWAGLTVNYSSLASVGAMLLVILVVLASVIYPSKVAGEIAIPDINRSWTLPPAQGITLTLTLPFLMTHEEHLSIGGFLYRYFEDHRDITHGRFSTADITFAFVCDQSAPVEGRPKTEAMFEECLKLNATVWLAPFDFGIMQRVHVQFQPSADQQGYLEIVISLVRQSGEANAWHRINKAFLNDLRKQLLIWRSFDEPAKRHYETFLLNAEAQRPLSLHQSMGVQ